MQDVPSPRGSTELFGCDAIEEIVPGDHNDGHTGKGPARQPNQRGECHHRGSDHEDDTGAEAIEIDFESPAEFDQCEINQDQRKAANKEETAKLAGAPRTAIEKGRKSREEDESGRRKNA